MDQTKQPNVFKILVVLLLAVIAATMVWDTFVPKAPTVVGITKHNDSLNRAYRMMSDGTLEWTVIWYDGPKHDRWRRVRPIAGD